MTLDREPAYSGSDGILYRNRSALPRAWLVGEFELERAGADLRGVAPDPALLDRLAGSPEQMRSRAILPAAPRNPPGAGAIRGNVSVEDTGFDSIRLTVETPENAILVLADPYYPGWTARLDGREAEIMRANFVLRAVEIPAGEHVLEMEFSGGSYAVGRTIALVGWSAMLLLLVASLFVDRRRAAPEVPA
jgi:hypothetical protein